MGADRRQHGRAHVLKRARLVYRSGWSSVDCVVLDLSPGGARIRLDALLGLPDRFELRVVGGPSRDAVVRFRARDEAGVAFVDGLVG